MNETYSPSMKRLPELYPGMGPALKKATREGFQVLERLSEEEVVQIFKESLETINSPVINSSTDQGNLAVKLKISEKDVEAAKSAVMAVIMPVSIREGVLEEKVFIDAAVQEEILQESNIDIAKKLFELASRESEAINKEMDESKAMDDVLPLLRLFDVTVDMKLKFDRSGISKMYPVAVLHLDTDSYGQEVWLQLSKRQVEKILAELNTVREQMELAEKTALTLQAKAAD